MKILIGDLQNNPFPGGKGLFYKFLSTKILPIQYTFNAVHDAFCYSLFF